MKPEPGMLLWADLGQRLPPGQEQQGGRPVLLVGVPAKLGSARFPMLIVAPVTSYREQPWAQSAPTLYPRLEAGVGGLPRTSLVLLDPLQAMDPRRIRSYLGRLAPDEYEPIRASWRALFEL